MTTQKRLIEQIQRAEKKLEDLKSKYIVLYGYNDLTIDSDGQVTEKATRDAP